MSYALYVLAARGANRTYVGVTTDVARRLRQHNGELAGGARATRGRAWDLLATVFGFQSGREARQLEWRLHRRRWRDRGADRPAARLRDLERALAMERWTRAARPVADMDLRLRITSD
jgi:structure-specific endonuclease subunit SLX1